MKLLPILVLGTLIVAGCGQSAGVVGSDDPITLSAEGQYEGYGDFSDVPYSDIDWYEVTALEVRCANDNGIPVRLIPPGDGFSFGEVPPEQSAVAMEVVEACEKALKLPAYEPAGRAELEEIYAYMVALASCLETQGHSVSDPPSVEVFVDSHGSWNPYDYVPHADIKELDRLQQACPQQPTGGYGAWEPGDPVTPGP